MCFYVSPAVTEWTLLTSSVVTLDEKRSDEYLSRWPELDESGWVWFSTSDSGRRSVYSALDVTDAGVELRSSLDPCKLQPGNGSSFLSFCDDWRQLKKYSYFSYKTYFSTLFNHLNGKKLEKEKQMADTGKITIFSMTFKAYSHR